MSLYRFFKSLTCLPTAEEAGLSAHTTEEANRAVEEVSVLRWKTRSIQKASLLKFVRYAVENGNGAEGWSMQLFKCNHI